jgi:phage tail protein X
MIVAAEDREPIDRLVWRATGAGAAAVALVLAANPGLAESAIALPLGTEVTIPDLPVTATTLDVVQLWS